MNDDLTSAIDAVAKVMVAASDELVKLRADCTSVIDAVAKVRDAASEDEAVATRVASELEVCEMNVLVSPSVTPNEEDMAITFRSVPAKEDETEST